MKYTYIIAYELESPELDEEGAEEFAAEVLDEIKEHILDTGEEINLLSVTRHNMVEH